MAWLKKEAPDTSYLKDERSFVQSASYEARKAFVQNNRDRFGKWNYTGTTTQNEKFRNKLIVEEDLRIKYEREVRSIRQETKKELRDLRMTTQRDIDSVNEFRTRNSAHEVRNMGTEARNKLDRETQLKDINNRLFEAWVKDLDGGLFDNGLIGALTKPSSKLNKALIGIEQDYGPQIRRNIELNLAQYRDIMMQVDWASKGQKWAMTALLWSFGYKNPEQIAKTLTDSRYIRNDIKGRMPAIASTLLVLGVSSALGNPTLYLGNLKLPISIQKTNTPSKDIAAYALFGTNASIVESDADRALGRYVEKTAKLSERDTRNNKGNIEETLFSLDPNIDWNAREAGIQEKANTQKIRLIRQAELSKISDPNVDDYSKYGILVRNPDLTKNNPQMRKLQQRILQKYWLNFMQKASGGTLELGKIMAPYTTAEEFINSHVIPHPNIEKYIRQFYATLDGNILANIVHSPDTPGAVSMINAYTRRGDELARYLRDTNNRTTVNINRRSNKYAGDIRNIISNSDSVANYIQNTAINGVPLENTYAQQINQLTGISWTPQYIVNQIRSNGIFVERFAGVNTARNQRNATRINYNGPALVTAIGYRKNGIHGYQLIGIKWDCANIVVWGWYPDSEFSDNRSIKLPLRLPIAIQKSWFDRPDKKTTKPEEPGEPNKPTPEGPGTPGTTPEGPGTPTTPETPAISTPGGEVVDVPTPHTWWFVNWTAINSNANASGAAVNGADTGIKINVP